MALTPSDLPARSRRKTTLLTSLISRQPSDDTSLVRSTSWVDKVCQLDTVSTHTHAHLHTHARTHTHTHRLDLGGGYAWRKTGSEITFQSLVNFVPRIASLHLSVQNWAPLTNICGCVVKYITANCRYTSWSFYRWVVWLQFAGTRALYVTTATERPVANAQELQTKITKHQIKRSHTSHHINYFRAPHIKRMLTNLTCQRRDIEIAPHGCHRSRLIASLDMHHCTHTL